MTTSFTGFVPFFRNKFPLDFSRTQIDFSRVLKFTLTLALPMLIRSSYCLPYTSYFLVEFNRFPELFRTSGLFPGLSSPRENAIIKFQDFPGYPGPVRTLVSKRLVLGFGHMDGYNGFENMITGYCFLLLLSCCCSSAISCKASLSRVAIPR